MEYKTVKKHGITSIIMKCPKCGKEGNLIRIGLRSSGSSFGIRHGKKICKFGPLSDISRNLEKIYKEVREI